MDTRFYNFDANGQKFLVSRNTATNSALARDTAANSVADTAGHNIGW